LVVADSISAHITSGNNTRTYDGNGICYVEFGNRRAGRVDVTFAAGQTPFGHFDTATETIAAEKDEYGASRLQRWIGAA